MCRIVCAHWTPVFKHIWLFSVAKANGCHARRTHLTTPGGLFRDRRPTGARYLDTPDSSSGSQPVGKESRRPVIFTWSRHTPRSGPGAGKITVRAPVAQLDRAPAF